MGCVARHPPRTSRLLPVGADPLCHPAAVSVPSELTEASTGERLRVISLSVLRMLVTVAAVLLLYAAIPTATSAQDLLDGVPLLIAALTLFALAFAWQIRRIRRSRHPGLRALEAGVTSLALFLLVFATFYLTWDATHPGAFTEPLDHLNAMYFTVTVFATVGFGDITPVGDTARVVTSLQMLLDLVFIGALLKILFQVAQSAQQNRRRQAVAAPTIEP